jgi:hypothetical protein
MKNKVIDWLTLSGFDLVSDDSSQRKIFVFDNILVSVEEKEKK